MLFDRTKDCVEYPVLPMIAFSPVRQDCSEWIAFETLASPLVLMIRKPTCDDGVQSLHLAGDLDAFRF
jgi:hypothetical protein